MSPKDKDYKSSMKKAAISCFLTWLVPGMGHLYLGKKLSAAVFFCTIHAAFILGFIHDGRFFLVDDRHSAMSYLQTMTNIAVGPLDIAGRSYIYGYPIYFLSKHQGEFYHSTILKIRRRIESPVSGYGTAYLLTAGLMNILLFLDVFDISIRRKE